MTESHLTRDSEAMVLAARADSAVDRRVKRTFIVRGFSARDTVLLRFLLDVARDKTRHAWTYAAELPADLVFLGPDAGDTERARAERERAGVTIRVRREGAASPGELSLPFKADDLVRAVDGAGETDRARGAAPAQPSGTDRIALKRWPDASVLGASSWNLKLAAMLTGKPLTAAELAAKSGAPEEACATFVQALLARDLAIRLPASASEATAVALAGATAPDPASRRAASPLAAPAARGLIARIRARLRI